MTITTTTIQTPTDPTPHAEPAPVAPRRRRRWLAFAVAAALGAGALGVVFTSDGAEGPRSEWTSEDGLRWVHPDGRSYVVATPQSIVERPSTGS